LKFRLKCHAKERVACLSFERLMDKQIKKSEQAAVGRLVVLNGPQKGKYFILHEGKNRIGRSDPNEATEPDVDLSECDPDSTVSRTHAIVSCQEGQAIIEDAGSLNGTALNRSKEAIPIGKTVELRPNDEIMIGRLFLRFELATAASQALRVQKNKPS
jgi:pSer/pThr/pTyr-binding forkhead associated (FHA) protein